MNKKGLLKFLVIIIAIVVVSGATIYFKAYDGGFQITSGNITIGINYSLTTGNAIEQVQNLTEQDYDDNITITEIPNIPEDVPIDIDN